MCSAALVAGSPIFRHITYRGQNPEFSQSDVKDIALGEGGKQNKHKNSNSLRVSFLLATSPNLKPETISLDPGPQPEYHAKP